MKAAKKNSTCTFEALESRQMMTATPWAPTEMSQLPAHYGSHPGLSTLYLNFDGGTISDATNGNRTIAAFAPQGTQDRTQAIQDIVYKVSEIFSPFNIRVKVESGAGNYSTSWGDTTIFIGDNAANVDSTGHNETYSMTPNNSVDCPSSVKGYGHASHSDNYNLAFVDPVSYDPSQFANVTSESNLQIAQDAAHEAGHTFGLWHVLSSPTNDIMSYNTWNNPAFTDQSFATTDENYNGSTTTNTGQFPTVNAIASDGSTYALQIKQQNSFAYLRNELGGRDLSYDSYPEFCADSTAISPDYHAAIGDPMGLTPSSAVTQMLSRLGEYDAYTYTNVSNNRFVNVMPNYPTRISLKIGNANGGSLFDPQILLYSSDGKTLLAATHGSTLQYTMANNASYKVVIGGFLGNSAGQYTMSFSKVQPVYQMAPDYAAATTTNTITTSSFSNTAISNSVDQSILPSQLN